MSKQNLLELAAERLNAAQEGSRNASKYDFVKVKVWLGADMAHYYVLSRFLISRMLTVTKVPHHKAIKIALAVKKHLVDNDRLDITQAELETILFSIMHGQGFGEEFVTRYRMVNQFFQQKRPLIILICGTVSTGKSTFAQQLASRLNLPNVLQTDILYELLRTGDMGTLSSTPLWCREGLADGDLVSEFQKECRIIRQGLEGDLCKAIKDGKPIIVEGLHLDPGLYLDEFGRHGMVGLGGTASLELPSDTAGAVAEGRPPTQQAPESGSSVTESVGGSHAAPSSHPSSQFGEEWRECFGGIGCIPEEPVCASMAPPAPACPPCPDGLPAPGDTDELVPPRRSASFSEASSSGLAYTTPAYSRQSPWRHLRPGGFLHRLLHRPGSAREGPRLGQAQRSSTQPERAQHAERGPGMKRASSLGHVTFMLHQQGGDSSFSPTPIMPGSEIVLPLEQEPSPTPPANQADAQRAPSMAGGDPSQQEAARGEHTQAAQPPWQRLLRELTDGQGQGGHVVGAMHEAGAGAGEPSKVGVAASKDPHVPEGPCQDDGALGASRLCAGEDAGERQAEVGVQQCTAPHAATAASPGASPSGRPPSQGPVFVPLVLCMDARDYEVVVQEWQATQGCPALEALAGKLQGASQAHGEPPEICAALHDRCDTNAARAEHDRCAVEVSGGGGQGGRVAHGGEQSSGVMHRLQVLQHYLCAYGAAGVPVVSVNVGNFSETLDKLHDYLLQCIQMSL